MEAALQELYEEGEPDDEVAVILRLANPLDIPDGARVIARFGPIATCRLRRGDIASIRSQVQVLSMKRPRLYSPTPVFLHDEGDSDGAGADDTLESTSDAPIILSTDQRRPDGIVHTGKGVVVAHIDWGIDFAHPEFLTPEGRTRLLALWDQGAAYDPGRPNVYGYGRIYFADEINQALAEPNPYTALGYDPAKSDRGTGTHGCHTSSISAGNGAGGGPVGLAPEASLIFVELSTYTAEGPTSLGDSVALLEAFDFIGKVADPHPCSINTSLGRIAGDHTGKTLTEQGMDAFLLERPGRFISMSTGNYFSRQTHASGEIRPGETETIRFIIDEADRTPNEVDLWYPGVDRFQITLRGPRDVVEVTCDPDERSSIVIDGKEVGRLYHRIGDPNNGDNEVTLFLYRAAPAGEWELSLFGMDVADGRYHAWIERDAGCPHCQARFVSDDVEPTSTIGTICNGFRTIAVGAYDAHRDEHPLGSFSSCGPTRDGRTKPDLVAPGVRVLAARSRPRLSGIHPPRLTRMSGTSMAAPHVTGTVALIFEAAGRPLAIDETRRLLLASTLPPAGDASEIDFLRLGSGYLDTRAAVVAAEQTGLQSFNSIRSEVSGESIGFDACNQSARCITMDSSTDDTNYSDDSIEQGMLETDALIDIQDAYPEDDAEARREKDRSRKYRYARGPRQIRPSVPFQVQVPITGGSPSLAVPIGGYRSPVAFTVPLGSTPAASPSVSGVAGTAQPTTTQQPGSQQPGVQQPSTQPSTTQTSTTQQPGTSPSIPGYDPYAFEPPLYEPPASEPNVSEPVKTEPVGDEPPVVVASDEPLYVPPDGVATQSMKSNEQYSEARREKFPNRVAPMPFQIQVPITGGSPALAVPVGGYGSPLAFSVPLGGQAASASGSQTVSPIYQPTYTPVYSEPAVTVAATDHSSYEPPQENDIQMDAIEGCERGEAYIDSDFAAEGEAESEMGERLLEYADALAESDDVIPLSSSALLSMLWNANIDSDNESESETETESSLMPLSILGRKGPSPSATELFNTFVYPDHPIYPRNALHRHYTRLFDVLAYPGQPATGKHFRPGDLMIRVARGEGWGNVAVLASPGLYRHDQLAMHGLRGEDYPRLPVGSYVWVVEILPRRRRRADRFARRICDNMGRLLPDTLLLRPLPFGYREADVTDYFPGEDIGYGEQTTPPDSNLASSFVAAHSSRYCTPGQAGSQTCHSLTSPRTVRRVVIHALAVPSTSRRTGVEAVVANWQNAGRQASAHYLVDRDGTITQMVREDNAAFHTPGNHGNNNADSIGIEHADVCNDPAPFTTQLYESSAALVRDLASRHGFAINTSTVAGHNQVNPNHGDPGPYWDWEYYFLLLAWGGVSAASRPIRLVAAVTSLASAPAGWQVRRRRRIPNDHCASRRDPWGATYWRAPPGANAAGAEVALVVNEAGTYKVSLWWPDVSGANPATPVDVEVNCLSSPCTGTSTQTVVVNQRPNSGRWNDIAVVTVTQAPAEVKVRWRRDSTQRGWILADAARLLKIASRAGSTSGEWGIEGLSTAEENTLSGWYNSTEATGVNRSSADYVRWVQSSLNQITGAQLAVDGLMGPMTRSAIRAFQQQQGLVVDGIVGPHTESAIQSVLAGRTKLPTAPICTTLDHFPRGADTILPQHQPQLIAVASRILAEHIRVVEIIGYASSEGSDADNLALGMRRAQRVMRELRTTLERMRPGSSQTVNLIPTTRGESEQIGGGAYELNRRVTICLRLRRTPPPSPACTCSHSTRNYTHGNVPTANLIGTKAKIKTRYGKVCCEGTTATSSAFKVAWTGVTKPGGTMIWAQTGYGRERNSGSSTVKNYRYWEVNGTSYNVHYDVSHAPVNDSHHTYQCEVDNSTGKWSFKYDGTEWATHTDAGWRGKTGTRADFTGEIFNESDDMPGTSSNKCEYRECKKKSTGGAYVDAGFTTSNVASSDSSKWGATRVSATGINIWDKHPLP